MKWLATITLLAALAACSRCDGGTEPGSARGLPTMDDGAAPDVPMPTAVYKEAYEPARASTTAENARDRLDELEHDIDREAKQMR